MIIVYKDIDARSVFIKDSNGAQFVNSLQAVSSNNKVSIHDVVKDEEIVTEVDFDQFVKQDESTPYGTDLIETVNNLNVEFTLSGSSEGEIPSIKSSLAISLVEGEVLNYELLTDYGVGYEWDLSNVPGVVTVEGNSRKLVGGSSLATGTYTIPVKAINYNGEDSKTVTLTVSTPPFSNTKSINFANQDWLGANASLLSNTLGRSGNGSGSSEAWSIGFWFKGSTQSQGQVVMYYGANDTVNNGYIQVMQINSNGSKLLRLRYGSNNNNLKIQTLPGSITPGTWQHILITYDGGTTGSGSSSLNNYYSRFKIYIDNTLQSTNNAHQNYGYTGSIPGDNFRVGRFVSGNYMRDCRVDELAIWDSEQSSNVSSIYNSGTPHDLTSLSPKHWWRMGDGDTFPYLQDSGSAANCVFQMYNMTVADIVSDTP